MRGASRRCAGSARSHGNRDVSRAVRIHFHRVRDRQDRRARCSRSLERRLSNDPDDELAIAAEEQRKITQQLRGWRNCGDRHDHDTRPRHGARALRRPASPSSSRCGRRASGARSAAATTDASGRLDDADRGAAARAGHVSPDVRHRRLPSRPRDHDAVLSGSENCVQRARHGGALSRAAAPEPLRILARTAAHEPIRSMRLWSRYGKSRVRLVKVAVRLRSSARGRAAHARRSHDRHPARGRIRPVYVDGDNSRLPADRHDEEHRVRAGAAGSDRPRRDVRRAAGVRISSRSPA